jgi:hypothetical protein
MDANRTPDSHIDEKEELLSGFKILGKFQTFLVSFRRAGVSLPPLLKKSGQKRFLASKLFAMCRSNDKPN